MLICKNSHKLNNQLSLPFGYNHFFFFISLFVHIGNNLIYCFINLVMTKLENNLFFAKIK